MTTPDDLCPCGAPAGEYGYCDACLAEYDRAYLAAEAREMDRDFDRYLDERMDSQPPQED